MGCHSWWAAVCNQAPGRWVWCLWKAWGTVARVHIGQIIMSTPTKLENKQRVTDALHSQFSCSVVSDSVTPWTAACQASLAITNLQSLLRLMSIELVMSSNHRVLCHPLLLSSIFPNIRVFSKESVLCIRWPKYCSFSFSISPSNEYSGLISSRIDWFDLLRPSSNSLIARRPESLRSGDLLNVMGINMKTWQKSGSSQMAVGSNTSLIMAPWTDWGPCTPDKLGAVPSLLMPTNKSYFPIQKRNQVVAFWVHLTIMRSQFKEKLRGKVTRVDLPQWGIYGRTAQSAQASPPPGFSLSPALWGPGVWKWNKELQVVKSAQ